MNYHSAHKSYFQACTIYKYGAIMENGEIVDGFVHMPNMTHRLSCKNEVQNTTATMQNLRYGNI